MYLSTQKEGEKMKVKLKDISNIYRGLQIAVNEKEPPKNMQGIKEMKVLSYSSIYSYNEEITLTNTINLDAIMKFPKVYINVEKKVKEAGIKKGDIILPINNMAFEPHFVNWKSNEIYDDIVYHSKLILVQPVMTKIIPEFLFFLLNTANAREYFRNNAKEKNKDKYRLTCKVVEDLVVDIPLDLKEQQNIVNEIKKINEEKQKLENNFEKLI